MTVVVSACDLTIGWNRDAILLEHASFVIERGEVFGLLGRSAAGKSTLMRAMIGLEQPLAGHVAIHVGADPSTDGRPAFGVMFQQGALFGSMTVAENIALPLTRWTRLPESAIRAIARAKLRLVGLEAAENELPSALSGGMRKRAALARALALEPSLVFLDEPSSGLDPITSAELDHLIQTLARALGLTVVIVTHGSEASTRSSITASCSTARVAASSRRARRGSSMPTSTRTSSTSSRAYRRACDHTGDAAQARPVRARRARGRRDGRARIGSARAHADGPIPHVFRRVGLGLEVGSAVTFRGVRVGNVGSIAIAPDRTRIDVALDLARTHLSELDAPTLDARLQSSGITGVKFINLEPRSADEALPALAFTPAASYIPAHRSLLSSLEARAEDLGRRASTLVDHTTIAVDKLAALVDDVRDQHVVTKLRTVLDHADVAIGDLHRVARGLERASLPDKASAMLGHIDGAAARLRDLLGKLDSGDDLRETIRDIGDGARAFRDFVDELSASRRS